MLVQTNEFVIQKTKGIVQRVGKSSIMQPKTNYNGKETKWFDDSKLLKKEANENEKICG